MAIIMMMTRYDNLARSLAMMEDELRRADERVKNAESRVCFVTILVIMIILIIIIWHERQLSFYQVVTIEDELSAIGENQKQLEVSEEKARRREEKYQVSTIQGWPFLFIIRTKSSSWTFGSSSQIQDLSMLRWTSASSTIGLFVLLFVLDFKYLVNCFTLFIISSGLTNWKTRSSGRSWRSTRSLASWTTPSMRCSTSTRMLLATYSGNV